MPEPVFPPREISKPTPGRLQPPVHPTKEGPSPNDPHTHRSGHLMTGFARDLNGTPIPPAFRRVPVRKGTTLTVRARRNAPPPTLTVEAADGTPLLTISIRPDGLLDMTYDPNRVTEAARRLLIELAWLLDPNHAGSDPSIAIATDVAAPPPSQP